MSAPLLRFAVLIADMKLNAGEPIFKARKAIANQSLKTLCGGLPAFEVVGGIDLNIHGVSGLSDVGQRALRDRSSTGRCPSASKAPDGAIFVFGVSFMPACAVGSGAGWWASVFDLWQHPAFLSVSLPAEAYEQVTLETRYFAYVVEVRVADGGASRSGLIQIGRDGQAAATNVRWSRPE